MVLPITFHQASQSPFGSVRRLGQNGVFTLRSGGLTGSCGPTGVFCTAIQLASP